MIWVLLKLMLTRGLSINRWNNFPRIENVSLLDNLWNTLHIALFLAYLEEKNWQIVDKEFLIKRIIFSSFKTLILSDINSWTREAILKVDKDIFSKLEQKAQNYLLALDWPDYIKADIKEVLENKDKILELNILKASKKYAWYIECKVNQKVYEDMYEVPMAEIMLWLEKYKEILPSFKTLLNNSNYQKYLSHLRRLSHSMRWNQQTRIFPISVMSHLVIITFLAYIIWKMENHNWKNYDMLTLLQKAIYHDIPEAITWDVIAPTKRAVPGFAEALEKVEISMMDEFLFSCVESDYKKQVYSFMLEPFEWETWKLVKFADIISSLFEAKVEVNHWSQNFIDVYRWIKQKVNTFDSLAVNYILKHWIDGFDDKSNDDILLERY